MNFEYLKSLPRFENLYKTCLDAERFAKTEPSISAAAARRAIEYLVKLLYSTYVSRYTEGLSIYEMLTDTAFVRYVDNRELIDRIHFVRRYGNRAVHENNVEADEARKVLEALHAIVGDTCVFLGLADKYPEFDPSIPDKSSGDAPMSAVDLELSQTLVAELNAQIRKRRQDSAKTETAEGAAVFGLKGNISQTDSGGRSKAAFRAVSAYMESILPECSLGVDNVKGAITLSADNGNEAVLSVKSGCPVLSTVVKGTVQLLPGIDVILYATELVPDKEIAEQLHVFSREEFLEMWNDCGLIRKKVSSAMTRKYQELYGPSFKTDKDIHADVVSVQTFSNSGKRSRLVREACEKRPVLADGGLDIIRSYLRL